MNFVDHLKLGGKAGHNMGINMMKEHNDAKQKFQG
jgi:hypothetical protein